MDQWLTAAGEWTTLEWDFTNLPSGIYDRLVFMFDVGTQGDGTDNSTFYFDDIAWFDADGDLATPDLPLTWEEPETYYNAYGFEGSAVSFASDPEDATNTVLEVLKTSLHWITAGWCSRTATVWQTPSHSLLRTRSCRRGSGPPTWDCPS